MSTKQNLISRIGHRAIDSIWLMGVATRFLMQVLWRSGTSWRRFHLIIREIYASGVLSLVIIIVSGLATREADGSTISFAGLRNTADIWQ